MLKKTLIVLLFISCVAGVVAKPNIIVIFTDDQGYGDLGVHGQLDDIKTPNLDALAKDGITCTAGYITAPQCTPSRAGLLTGRYPQRFDFDHIPDGPLPLEEVTIAERLQKAGYVTGHVGKWHLEPSEHSVKWAKKSCPEQIRTRSRGQEYVHLTHELKIKYESNKQGFDDFFSGWMNQYWRNFDLDGNDLMRTGELIDFPESEYRIDIKTDAALAFIDRNHKEPFFLYLCYFAPHTPLVAPEKYLSRFPGKMPERRRTALAMMSAMDDGVGKIREKLKDYGLDRDTIIFYIADNGAPLGAHSGAGWYMKDVLPVEDDRGGVWDGSRNDPFVGEKGMLMEGGIRVPFLVSWPAKLPKGLVYDEPVSALDVTPTCLVAAGKPIPAGLDGENLMPFLEGEKNEPRTLYWRFWNQAAVREGDLKYLVLGDGKEYLVDVKTDLQERNNLVAKYPEKAIALRRKLSAWCDELKPVGLPSKPLNREETEFYKFHLKGQK